MISFLNFLVLAVNAQESSAQDTNTPIRLSVKPGSDIVLLEARNEQVDYAVNMAQPVDISQSNDLLISAPPPSNAARKAAYKSKIAELKANNSRADIARPNNFQILESERIIAAKARMEGLVKANDETIKRYEAAQAAAAGRMATVRAMAAKLEANYPQEYMSYLDVPMPRAADTKANVSKKVDATKARAAEIKTNVESKAIGVKSSISEAKANVPEEQVAAAKGKAAEVKESGVYQEVIDSARVKAEDVVTSVRDVKTDIDEAMTRVQGARAKSIAKFDDVKAIIGDARVTANSSERPAILRSTTRRSSSASSESPKVVENSMDSNIVESDLNVLVLEPNVEDLDTYDMMELEPSSDDEVSTEEPSTDKSEVSGAIKRLNIIPQSLFGFVTLLSVLTLF